MSFPSPKMRAFLLAYRLLWTLLLPVALAYLFWRARKDRDYGTHLAERFGNVPLIGSRPVWIHAVSIGEFRSARPLIDALLDRGETLCITCFTPAGRREATAQLAQEIAKGTASVSWVPLDLDWAWRRFLRRVAPKYGLVMEIEIWPRMIATCRTMGIPLFRCNAQYPLKRFNADAGRATLQGEIMTGFAGALVKSDLQQDRFNAVGQHNVAVTGELRFDQPLPSDLIAKGAALRKRMAPDRSTLCFASVVEGEDALLIRAIAQIRDDYVAAHLSPPLMVYIPRAPERFDAAYALLAKTGLRICRRSQLLSAEFTPQRAPDCDVLLGDSLGEMYGYLAMADRVVVGGSFNPNGAHNISEALAMGKPVWAGPHIWTIEYPATEALAAGVLRQTEASAASLAKALGPDAPAPASAEQIADFMRAHQGAAKRTLAAIPDLLANTPSAVYPRTQWNGDADGDE